MHGEGVERNAIIESVELTLNPCTTVWIHVKYGDGCFQGFGGFRLYHPGTWSGDGSCNVAGHFITRCMEIAGVSNWNDMPGKAIRVECDDSRIRGIGHIIQDNWFYPADDFKGL